MVKTVGIIVASLLIFLGLVVAGLVITNVRATATPMDMVSPVAQPGPVQMPVVTAEVGGMALPLTAEFRPVDWSGVIDPCAERELSAPEWCYSSAELEMGD